MANAVKKKLYDTFIADVAALYAKAQKTVALTYWEIGRRIVEVEQDGAVRASSVHADLKSLTQANYDKKT